MSCIEKPKVLISGFRGFPPKRMKKFPKNYKIPFSYLNSSISGVLSWASLSLGRKAADPATLGLDWRDIFKFLGFLWSGKQKRQQLLPIGESRKEEMYSYSLILDQKHDTGRQKKLCRLIIYGITCTECTPFYFKNGYDTVSCYFPWISW